MVMARVKNLSMNPLVLSDGRLLPVNALKEDFEVADNERRLEERGMLLIQETTRGESELPANQKSQRKKKR